MSFLISSPKQQQEVSPPSWDNPDDPDCRAMRKKTHMPEVAYYREKRQRASDLIDLAGTNGVPHRAVVADCWYGIEYLSTLLRMKAAR